MKQHGTLFLLVGPSRVGKDSILKGLLSMKSLGLRKLVTATTRERRSNEVSGKTYYYLSNEEFLNLIRTKQLLEWAPVRNHQFGTPKEPLLTWLRAGYKVLQQIDVRGADALQRRHELKVVTIFILPGSLDELRRRLHSRAFTHTERRIRWRETVVELKKQAEYDYRVVNEEGKLKQTIYEVAAIIRSTTKPGG